MLDSATLAFSFSFFFAMHCYAFAQQAKIVDATRDAQPIHENDMQNTRHSLAQSSWEIPIQQMLSLM